MSQPAREEVSGCRKCRTREPNGMFASITNGRIYEARTTIYQLMHNLSSRHNRRNTLTRYLRTIGALFAMLALLVTAASASAASGRGGGSGHRIGAGSKAATSAMSATATSTVTQTFKLKLYGAAPRGDAMIVKYRTIAPNGTTSGAQVHVFCGDFRSSLEDYPAKPACKGGGTVYTRSMSVPKGYSIVFSFERQKATNARDASAIFYKGSHKLYYNWLDSAWYRYGA